MLSMRSRLSFGPAHAGDLSFPVRARADIAIASLSSRVRYLLAPGMDGQQCSASVATLLSRSQAMHSLHSRLEPEKRSIPGPKGVSSSSYVNVSRRPCPTLECISNALARSLRPSDPITATTPTPHSADKASLATWLQVHVVDVAQVSALVCRGWEAGRGRFLR